MYTWSFTIKKQLLSSIAVSLLLGACGGKRDYPDASDERKVPHWKPSGTLGEQLSYIRQDSDWLEACDLKVQDAQQKIVDVLDARKVEISEYISNATSKNPSKLKYHTYKTQNGIQFAIRDSVYPKAPDEWLSDESDSWSDLAQLFDQVLKTPISEEWLYLNSSVRSLLVDDRSRIVGGTNYYIKRTDKRVLERLAQATKLCMKELTHCGLSDLKSRVLEKQDWALLENNPYFSWYLNRISEGGTLLTPVSQLEARLMKRILRDDEDLNFFESNKTLRRTREVLGGQDIDQLSITVHTKDFLPAQSTLASILEQGWSLTKNRKLKIEWVDANNLMFDVDGIFSVFRSLETGARSFVSFSKGTVNLVQPPRSGTILHEFGHVLGLPDNYHTIWDSKNCRYLNEYKSRDVMSDSYLGEVLDEHWERLLSKYPVDN